MLKSDPSIFGLFPNANDCTNGHLGPSIMTYFWEQDDDRGWLMKIPRCAHCNIPIGGDEYATDEEEEIYYRTLPA